MLVLSRKPNETVRIGEDVRIRIVSIEGATVKLGIEAPAHVSVHRGEVYERIQEENRAAAMARPTDALSRLARAFTVGRRAPGNASGRDRR